MPREPKLASKTYEEGGVRYSINVVGGLRVIRGNRQPYFTITADQYLYERGRWVEDSGGCLHELIEKLWPGHFTDLIAMHLSYEDGEPMHAVADGVYYAKGGSFFAGSWMPIEERCGDKKQASDEFLVARLMSHLRCDEATAWKLRTLGKRHVQYEDDLREWQVRDERFQLERSSGIGVYPGPKPVDPGVLYQMQAMIEGMRPRWQAEAKACIAKHGLKVFP